MKSINFKDKIEKEIVETIQSNEGVHEAINNVVKDRFVEKETFDQRFDRILEEMRVAREKSDERWERNDRRWEKNDRRWEESQKRWDKNDLKWEESKEQWEKNDQRWEENQKAINEILSSIKIVEINDEKLKDLFSSTVGALGARWGIRSEQSFRNALRGILEKNTDLKVLHVVEPDEDGIVFGRPEQVELDIVLKNGKFMIIEIKSSLSRADVILFVKKAEFYQERHNTKATALVMISPMIDDNAQDYIAHFGIIAYSFATEVDPVILD
jgi:hypothetical protein